MLKKGLKRCVFVILLCNWIAQKHSVLTKWTYKSDINKLECLLSKSKQLDTYRKPLEHTEHQEERMHDQLDTLCALHQREERRKKRTHRYKKHKRQPPPATLFSLFCLGRTLHRSTIMTMMTRPISAVLSLKRGVSNNTDAAIVTGSVTVKQWL